MGRDVQPQTEIEASAAVYSKLTLAVYDLYVIGFSNTFVWRCPSRKILEFYNQHVSANHLDVGVGTGYFLDKCRFPARNPVIALLDLNPNSLQATAKRLQRYGPTLHVGNVLALIDDLPAGYASIGVNYLLHCLAGDMKSKAAVFRNLKPLLAPGGVLFGTTILGQGVEHNFLGKRLMATYNRKGIFGNEQDNARDLEDALAENFICYDLDVVGCVALFSGTV